MRALQLERCCDQCPVSSRVGCFCRNTKGKHTELSARKHPCLMIFSCEFCTVLNHLSLWIAIISWNAARHQVVGCGRPHGARPRRPSCQPPGSPASPPLPSQHAWKEVGYDSGCQALTIRLTLETEESTLQTGIVFMPLSGPPSLAKPTISHLP
jgi:hypothetical protein